MELLRILKVVVACWLLGRLTARGISRHLLTPERGRKSAPYKRRNPWFYQGLDIVRHRLASSVISEGDGTRTRNHRIDSRPLLAWLKAQIPCTFQYFTRLGPICKHGCTHA